MMASRIVRIDFDGAAMMPFGNGPIKVVGHGGKAHRTVCFSYARIQLNGFARRFLSRRRTVVEIPDTKDSQPSVRVSNARIGERVVRIKLDSVVVALQGWSQASIRYSCSNSSAPANMIRTLRHFGAAF